MPKHRGLNLRTFVDSIPSDLMERYFKERHAEARLPLHIIMNAEAVEKFMSDERNVKSGGVLKLDFTKINDLCGRGKSLIVHTYKRYDLTPHPKHAPQGMAMKLFLDRPDAFDYAYAWYSYYNASSAMSYKQMPGAFKLTATKIGAFKKEVQEWFAELAKGKEIGVRHYREKDSTVILVSHGTYIRTVPFWADGHVETQSFRLALEDILIYDEKAQILGIKASLKKDRTQYVHSFSRCIMGDESLAEREDLNEVYSLKPLQDGAFNWDGDGTVTKIILLGAKVDLEDSIGTVVNLDAQDIRSSLDGPHFNFDLGTGKLLSVKLWFYLEVDGKEDKVRVNIEPPAMSDLAQKQHREIIGEYLKKQKVKLV